MADKVLLKNITIVLQRPRIPENIGAAARAMHNMGLSQLVVVNPGNYDINRIKKTATHEAAGIVDRIEQYDDLKEALASYTYVVGSTARVGKLRQAVDTPKELSEKLLPISQENRIAVLFGPEDRGLTNDDLRNCHTLVNIPTDKFSSLNLAQAVMILCYEIFHAGRKKDVHTARLAERHELEGMYEQLKEKLIKINFINPENPDYWLDNLRSFINRLPLRAKEVRIIRGICKQIDWFGEKQYKDGLKDKN